MNSKEARKNIEAMPQKNKNALLSDIYDFLYCVDGEFDPDAEVSGADFIDHVSFLLKCEGLPNSENPKSKGQLAYEEDVKRKPFYHDGTHRKTWNELDAVVKSTWEKNPTPKHTQERA